MAGIRVYQTGAVSARVCIKAPGKAAEANRLATNRNPLPGNTVAKN